VNSPPDTLVLGGGGRQGDAWMTGVLAGLEDARGFDLRGCDYFVGTSAGSVITARLADGETLRRPGSQVAGGASGEQPLLPNWAANSITAIAAPFAALGLRLGRMPGELARATALGLLGAAADETLDFVKRFPSGSTRWDGRLRVVAVDRGSGKRVVFGAPGGPRATVAQALAASCALPLVFSPAVIGGREYVDGAMWSPSNADVAPAGRDAEVLILSPMASLHGPFHAGVRAASLGAVLLEEAALTARGARPRVVTPDRASSAAIGQDIMSGDGLDQTRAAGYAQGLSL